MLDQLAVQPGHGYRIGQAPHTEPTALAALALLANGHWDVALPSLRWLADIQAADGSLGINAAQSSPCWPTALAILAWQAAGSLALNAPPSVRGTPFEENIRRAVSYILRSSGEALPRNAFMAHDTTLIGWSWVAETHSWVEPTAWHLLALHASGQAGSQRFHEGVRLLMNRQLPRGGWNYGNTVVLGQELRPHVQPTGLTVLALASAGIAAREIEKSLAYLESHLDAAAPVSLSYACMGLAAFGRLPESADRLLEAASATALRRGASPLSLAMLALAASGRSNPLIAGRQGGSA